jgi:halocyanin-like protein
MSPERGMTRRDVLRLAGAGAVSAGASGTAAAQKGGGKSGGGSAATGPIDFGGWLEDLSYWSGQAKDMTGKEKVTITVGGNANKNLSFAPVAIHVSPGTNVTWKWSGKGGAHNVVSKENKFKSGSPVAKAGHTFSHTFKKNGINNYYCQPHRTLGMKGSVAVGKVPHKKPVTPATPAVSQQAKTLGVATFTALLSTLGLAYFFIKYGGDYER